MKNNYLEQMEQSHVYSNMGLSADVMDFLIDASALGYSDKKWDLAYKKYVWEELLKLLRRMMIDDIYVFLDTINCSEETRGDILSLYSYMRNRDNARQKLMF